MSRDKGPDEPTWVEVRPAATERRGSALVNGLIGVAGAGTAWLAGVATESEVEHTSFADNLADVGVLAAGSTVVVGVVSAIFTNRQ